jgi:hypothetical protein
MERLAKIRRIDTLYFMVVILLFFSSSCGISELREIETVKIKAHPKVVLPLAYGTIDIGTLASYLSPGSEGDFFKEDGYFPFEKVFEEISIPDTFAFGGTLFEKLSEVELRIETFNHLPMGIDLELYFVDASTFTTYGDPIKCPFLKPAVVDNEGKAIATTHHVETTIIPDSQFALYKNANAIIMMVRLYLPESESSIIYLHKDDFLSLNVGLAVRVTTGGE